MQKDRLTHLFGLYVLLYYDQKDAVVNLIFTEKKEVIASAVSYMHSCLLKDSMHHLKSFSLFHSFLYRYLHSRKKHRNRFLSA